MDVKSTQGVSGVTAVFASAFKSVGGDGNDYHLIGDVIRAQLQEEKRLRIMLQLVPLPVIMRRSVSEIIDCSEKALDVFGFSDKQELIESFDGLMPEFQSDGRPSRDVIREHITQVLAAGFGRYEWIHLTSTGEVKIFEETLLKIDYKGAPAFLQCLRDVGEERKMLEELERRDKKLEEQSRWYKSILDGIPLPISVIGADMTLVYTNLSDDELPKSRDEMIGFPCKSWGLPICGTDDCCVARALRGQKQTFFKYGGISYQVDIEIIRNANGETLSYLEVIHDITEVESMARRQADKENETKSLFLANVSHEMRTPLNAVLGLAELMLKAGELSASNELYLEKIYTAGSTLLGIINDILDISKISAGKLELIQQEYNVPDVISETITQNTLRLVGKPIQFCLKVDEQAPLRLKGDDLRVKQIVSNLLSNSFKYTEKGNVELSLDFEREGDTVWVKISVSDTGIGIRPEDLERIYSNYTRFDNASNRKIDGIGLGLSIVKALIDMMEGTIGIESEIGKGTVVTVRFKQKYVGESVIGRSTAENLRTFSYITSRRKQGAQLERVYIPYARVLVVDDNPTNLEIAQGFLEPYGMQVDCVTGGQAAIDVIRKAEITYDAIFMDHMMPDIDGMQATRIIRSEIGGDYAKKIPIIAFTANAIAGNERLFIENGFNAYISKPLDIFQLDRVIHEWLWDEKKSADLGTWDFRERRKGGDRRSGMDRRMGSIQAEKEIEGLDWKRGVSIFGSEEAFSRILKSYAVNTRPMLDSITEVSASSLSEYAIVVHGIKSSSRGLCAEALGSLAESLELAAKAGNIDFVLLRNEDFIKACHMLIDDIENALGKNVAEDGKPKKCRPDEAVLQKLSEACDSYNMDAIDAAMAKIEQYNYTDDNGLVSWLRTNVDQLRYLEVVEKIALVKET